MREEAFLLWRSNGGFWPKQHAVQYTCIHNLQRPKSVTLHVAKVASFAKWANWQSVLIPLAILKRLEKNVSVTTVFERLSLVEGFLKQDITRDPHDIVSCNLIGVCSTHALLLL